MSKNDLGSESGDEECSDSESWGCNNIRHSAILGLSLCKLHCVALNTIFSGGLGVLLAGGSNYS